MKSIKIKTPAKINLTLEVLGKRNDGFHEIQSIMQAINLYDFLTIKIKDDKKSTLNLSGSSSLIPYDKKNIVYKAWELFVSKTNISASMEVYIEKNIPICAGLAGGSSNGAGFLLGINKLFDDMLTIKELQDICAQLGSDLNFCLEGGCALCTGRGEQIEKLPAVEMPVILIKPKHLEISAKEAYYKYSQNPQKINNNTSKLKELLLKKKFDKTLVCNVLEEAIINDYKELQNIKRSGNNAIMSGSGPTYFVLNNYINKDSLNKDNIIIEGLNFISTGCEVCLF